MLLNIASSRRNWAENEEETKEVVLAFVLSWDLLTAVTTIHPVLLCVPEGLIMLETAQNITHLSTYINLVFAACAVQIQRNKSVI